MVAHHFGAPVVFAKKTQSINLDGTMYSTRIQSFTHNRIYDSHRLHPFPRARRPRASSLTTSSPTAALCAVCSRSARAPGPPWRASGIAIEKGFQPGGDELREAGYDLRSLAIVEAMDPDSGAIEFRR